MDEYVVVEIAAGHTAQFESWLLGQGRLPAVLPDHLPGTVRYLVKSSGEEDLRHIGLAGGKVRKKGGWPRAAVLR